MVACILSGPWGSRFSHPAALEGGLGATYCLSPCPSRWGQLALLSLHNLSYHPDVSVLPPPYLLPPLAGLRSQVGKFQRRRRV